MLKHWSYRTLNLAGRITIIKSLALSKVSHLAIVLPELDEQQATRLEKLTFDFIWKTFNNQVKQGQVRINKERAKIEPEKGRLGIIDVKQFWNASKLTWLRKILTKDYNESERSEQQENQVQQPKYPQNTAEDWLVMIMNEMATISSDTDLTPIRMLTTWGTEKMRRHGLEIKKLILEKNLYFN